MSNGQRKFARASQKRRDRHNNSGSGAFTPPVEVSREALLGIMHYDTVIDAGYNNAVYRRGWVISSARPLTRRHLRRMLAHFDAHQKDRDRDWNDPDNDTPGKIAWWLNGGDAGAKWVRSLRDRL